MDGPLEGMFRVECFPGKLSGLGMDISGPRENMRCGQFPTGSKPAAFKLFTMIHNSYYDSFTHKIVLAFPAFHVL